MPLRIETLSVGFYDVNCHLLGCDDHAVCAVVDPGDNATEILASAKKNGWKIEKIINTHGHADHTGAVTKIKEASGAPFWLHAAEPPIAINEAMADMAAYLGVDACPSPDHLMEDGDSIPLCPCIAFEVIHTPGHTPGGVCLRQGDHLITGDTLFHLSIGRSDLPGGDGDQLKKSLATRIMPLPDSLTFYPGHGENSTLGVQKKMNPFLMGVM